VEGLEEEEVQLWDYQPLVYNLHHHLVDLVIAGEIPAHMQDPAAGRAEVGVEQVELEQQVAVVLAEMAEQDDYTT
jgi:hypothetical protein